MKYHKIAIGLWNRRRKAASGKVNRAKPHTVNFAALTGDEPHCDSKLLLMLGDFNVSELTTAQLRRRHVHVRDECGASTANRCRSFLKSILALAEEGFGVRTCKIPSNLPRRKHKPKKEILSPDAVGGMITA